MICPPCAEAADIAREHSFSVDHDPRICRDFAIQSHGCTCAHGVKGEAPSAPASSNGTKSDTVTG